MKRVILGFIGAFFLLGSGAAHAVTECEFKGEFKDHHDKKLVCKAILDGSCNAPLNKAQLATEAGGALIQPCHSFQVWCNGKRLTEGVEGCSVFQTMNGEDLYIGNFQYSDRVNNQCVFPSVRFDTPLPPKKSEVDARLYLDKDKILFGECKLPPPMPPTE